MEVNKTTTLKTYFRYFIVKLSLLLFLAVTIPFLALLIASNNGLVTRANQSEIQAKELKSTMMIAPDITKVVVPTSCKYIILDKSFNELYSNMKSTEDKSHAITFAKGEELGHNGNSQYLLVIRENEYCVIQYFIGSQYTNQWFAKHFPAPDILTGIVIIIGSILVFVIMTSKFSRKLAAQLNPLLTATGEISSQNLNFEIQQSSIKEFNDIVISFADMRDNLKSSLEKQWKAEQAQKEQISALAHDLKTPLTMIQGNADLLADTVLDKEQRLYTQYISESSEQMKLYIQILIDISKAITGYELKKEDVYFPDFWTHILLQIDMLCKSKNIVLSVTQNDLPEHLVIDKLLMERAITNIVANATDYAPPNTTLYVELQVVSNSLIIIFTDCGSGFTKEGLKHALDKFYMDDQSRGSKLHFGMGLFIVDSIVKQHGGKLHLENSDKTHGAQVTMSIPLKS